MSDKEVYNGLFEMLSYIDVLRHIAEKHPPEGETIVKNSQEMPVIWHELQHLNGDPGHAHLNNHKEALKRATELLEQLSTNSKFLKEIMELVEEDITEEFAKVDKYIQELDSE